MPASTTTTIGSVQHWPLVSRWPALVTIAFGLVMLYFVGFCPYPRAHNAAHDTRHANGFPCH